MAHGFPLSAIPRVPFDNPSQPESPVEVLAFAALRKKAPAGYLARPQRPAFHQVHVVSRGHCEPEIDFARVALKPGTVAWVHPGQVLRFDLDAAVEGWLLLFTADALEGELADERAGAPVGPSIHLGSARGDVEWLLDRIRRISGGSSDRDRSSLLHHLLHALLFTLCRQATSARAAAEAPMSNAFALFRREVERHFATTRRVEDYERSVGYSSKTLTRATKAALGLSAKQYIDQRVLLESRRLLAYTNLSVGEVGQRVGFSELTNFIKFFRREGGETPSEFRRRGS